MTRTAQVLIAGVVVLFLLFALSVNTQASMQPQIVRVTLTDYQVTLSRFTVNPGQPVDFRVENRGALTHRLVVQPYAEPPADNAADALVIAPGTQREFEQTLEPGVYRVECVAWDHAEKGMLNALAAQPPAQFLPVQMNVVVPLLILVIGCAVLIGESMGLRLVRP